MVYLDFSLHDVNADGVGYKKLFLNSARKHFARTVCLGSRLLQEQNPLLTADQHWVFSSQIGPPYAGLSGQQLCFPF